MTNAKIFFTCVYYKGRNFNNFVDYVAKRDGVDMSINSGFVDYLSDRPRSHGLFSASSKPPILAEVKKELEQHKGNVKGNVYASVISLRREDAERLEYNNASTWQNLLKSKQVEIAKNHKIPLQDLKWYAAFHNESHHPHVHLLVWNANPRNEYLTEQGIDNLRSCFANEIFHDEMMMLYADKTGVRDKLKSEFKKSLANLDFKSNPQIEKMMIELRQKLLETTGKKQYGYLKPPIKKLVDEIVSEVSKDENITKLYEKWCDLQKEIIGIYQTPKELPPLYMQKEFQSIKNAVIQEVLKPQEQKQDMSAALQNILFFLAGEIKDDYEKKHSKWSRNLDSKDYKKLAKKKLAMGQKLE